MKNKKFWQVCCTVLGNLLAIGLVVGRPDIVNASSQPTFSGQATVVKATVLGNTLLLSDTGPLPPSGGAQEASLLSVNVPELLAAEVLHASTIGQGCESRSEASVANADLTVGGNTISADLLMSQAKTACGPGGPSVGGSSEIANLVINGQAVTVTGEPNQTVPLPNGQVVINEQMTTFTKKSGDIVVNALHVVVVGVGDVIISSSHADITCIGNACGPCADFATGGGWITGTPSGAKGNFGVAGGIKNGQLWGHLVFIDHGQGTKVKGISVTAYTVVNATIRHIEGTADINGQGGFTYQVDISDNGEPGRNDTFNLTLSNGYVASGNLGGGNIQLHTCPR